MKRIALAAALLLALASPAPAQVEFATPNGQIAQGTTGIALATTATASISNGQSLSAAVDLGSARLARVAMPAAWTAASLTFQTSADGVTYLDLYDATGTEYTVQAAASRAIVVPLADFLGVRYLKVRSGTAGVPVSQGADRALVLVLSR